MGATAAIAFTAFGTATSAAGQIKAGNAAQRTGEVNAQSAEQISELNAQIIEQTAETNAGILDFNGRTAEAQGRDAIRRGFVDEERYGLFGRQTEGSQRAGFAGQGVSVDTGSPLDVVADTRYTVHQDLMEIRVAAAREAWGFQVDAQNSRMQRDALRKNAALQALFTRKQGKIEALNARLGGNYTQQASRAGAASTILSSAGTILGQQYGFSRAKKGA